MYSQDSTRTESIAWFGHTSDEKSATLSVRLFSPRERLLGAFNTLALFWLGAIVCILIPALHFFLVPAGLILGIVLAIKRFRLDEAMIESSGTCPFCAKDQTLPLNQARLQLPIWEYCRICNERIRIDWSNRSI